MSAMPDTIVLIHGLWMTPRSWEGWIERYRSRGYNVIAPAWPGMEGEVEALNADPSPIAELDVEQDRRPLRGHHPRARSAPPIIMGHSFGGAFTQVLLDRGFGAVGRRRRLGDRQGRARPPALDDPRHLPRPAQPVQHATTRCR